MVWTYCSVVVGNICSIELAGLKCVCIYRYACARSRSLVPSRVYKDFVNASFVISKPSTSTWNNAVCVCVYVLLFSSQLIRVGQCSDRRPAFTIGNVHCSQYPVSTGDHHHHHSSGGGMSQCLCCCGTLVVTNALFLRFGHCLVLCGNSAIGSHVLSQMCC